MDKYLISQIIGGIETVLCVIMLQQKKVSTILIMSIINNAVSAASNVFVGAYAGSAVCGFASLQTALALYLNRKKREMPLWTLLICMLGYVGMSVLTYSSAYDIIPGVAALIYCVSTVQKNSTRYRILIFFNISLWLVYELIIPVPNYMLALSKFLALTSTVVGLIRIKENKTETKGDENE